MGKSVYQPKRFAVVGYGWVGAIVAVFFAVAATMSPSVTWRSSLLAGLCRTRHPHRGDRRPPGESGQDDHPRGRPDRGSTDVLILAVKATALPLIASTLEGVRRRGAVRRQLAERNSSPSACSRTTWGAEFVLRAVVILWPRSRPGPAHVRIAFHHRPHYIQELDPRSMDVAVGISEAFIVCGLDTLYTNQLKALGLLAQGRPHACMNSAPRRDRKQTTAEIINDPILFHLVDVLIKEGVSVARANEYRLGSNFYPYCIDYIRNAGHHKPSMLQDIEAGRRTEVELHQPQDDRAPTARPGVPTPYNTMIRGLVKALEPK